MIYKDTQLSRINKKIAELKSRPADEVRTREVLRSLYERKGRIEHVEFVGRN